MVKNKIKCIVLYTFVSLKPQKKIFQPDGLDRKVLFFKSCYQNIHFEQIFIILPFLVRIIIIIFTYS